MKLPPLATIMTQARRLPARLGEPGIAGLGLLVAAAAFSASTLAPQGEQIDSLRRDVQALHERVRQAQAAPDGDNRPLAEQLAEYHSLLPGEQDLPEQIDKLFQLAQRHGLTLPQGEYQTSDSKPGGQIVVHVVLPLQGDYPRIRKFLDGLAGELPAVALEHISFERQKIGDAQVQATVKLNLYLEPQP